jgi:hypothetical protein
VQLSLGPQSSSRMCSAGSREPRPRTNLENTSLPACFLAYSVRAEAKGFKAFEHSNLLLEVGKDLRVDLTLQPGEQTQTVVVTGEPPMLETTNATLRGTLSNETINELPMMGRSYQNLLVLLGG